MHSGLEETVIPNQIYDPYLPSTPGLRLRRQEERISLGRGEFSFSSLQDHAQEFIHICGVY
jgi:hypothetical protein